MDVQIIARGLPEALEHEPGKLARLDQAAATLRDNGGDDAAEALTEAFDVLARGEFEEHWHAELVADVAYVSALVLVRSAS